MRDTNILFPATLNVGGEHIESGLFKMGSYLTIPLLKLKKVDVIFWEFVPHSLHPENGTFFKLAKVLI